MLRSLHIEREEGEEKETDQLVIYFVQNPVKRNIHVFMFFGEKLRRFTAFKSTVGNYFTDQESWF